MCLGCDIPPGVCNLNRQGCRWLLLLSCYWDQLWCCSSRSQKPAEWRLVPLQPGGTGRGGGVVDELRARKCQELQRAVELLTVFSPPLLLLV